MNSRGGVAGEHPSAAEAALVKGRDERPANLQLVIEIFNHS
jgi:hypothetical protein